MICYVSTRCCLAHNTTMEQNSSLEDLTLVPEGHVIPKNENWGGSPAVKMGINPKQKGVPPWSKRNFFYTISVFLIPLITMIAYFPGMMVITHFDYTMEEAWYNLPATYIFGGDPVCRDFGVDHHTAKMDLAWKYQGGGLPG